MLELTLLVAFPGMMAFAAASDLITMTIPNRLALALVATFGLVAVAGGLPPKAIGAHVGLAALVLVIGFGMFARGWIGGGDAKLAAATTLWLGVDGMTSYLLLAGMGGGALTIGLLYFRDYPLPWLGARMPWLARLQDPQTGVPYGIALAAAALAVYPQTDIWTVALS